MLATTLRAVPRKTPGLGRVGWTRGHGCLPLADHLGKETVALNGDLLDRCVEHRVDLLVARRFPKLALVPTVVPRSLELDRVSGVTAAIGGGPNSSLAAAVTARLAARVGVPGELATVYSTAGELAPTLERLDQLASLHPGLTTRVLKAASATKLIDRLPSSKLLVVGAPGGSLFYRQLYGPGHRLVVTAPAGTVVVRDAPRRCFQNTVDAAGIAIGPQLAAADALRIMGYPIVPVAEHGNLVGVLRRNKAALSEPHAVVADLMDPPVFVTTSDPASAAAQLGERFKGSPVPVIDKRRRLVGVIHQEEADKARRGESR